VTGLRPKRSPSSSDAIRLRRSLDTLPQGIVLCDENGTVVYRNARANALMTSRHGDALAAQAVTELLEMRGGPAPPSGRSTSTGPRAAP